MRVIGVNKLVFILVVTILAVGGCRPDGKNESIVRAHVGEYDLFIPEAYMSLPGSSIGKDSGLIYSYYPGSLPLPENYKETGRKDKWLKDIRIIFIDLNKYPDFDMDKILNGQKSLFKATKKLNREYDLIHYSQPENIKNDWGDIWVEERADKANSFVACRRKYDPDIVPHCSHRFHDQKFSYEISYDKRLLPDWKLIQANVLALMNSFETEAGARKFLAQQMNIDKEGN